MARGKNKPSADDHLTSSILYGRTKRRNSENSEHSWSKNGFSVSEQAAWEKYFSPEEAEQWKRCGFEATSAYYWREANFLPSLAQSWHQQVKDYFSNDQIMAGICNRWRQEEFVPHEAKEWLMSGFEPGSATIWRDCGFYDAAEAEEWSKQFTPEHADEWHNEESLSLEAAIKWNNRGVEPREAGRWIDAQDEHGLDADALFNEGYSVEGALEEFVDS